MTLTEEDRINAAPDFLDEMEVWFATAPREQVADQLATWLYDAIQHEQRLGTLSFARFKGAVDAAVRRLYVPVVFRQMPLLGGGGAD